MSRKSAAVGTGAMALRPLVDMMKLNCKDDLECVLDHR